MIIKNLKNSLLICSALLLSSANNTFAATASGTMAASATAVGTCSVAASTMAFGTLNFGSTTTATSTITPNCTSGISYTVTNAADTNTLLLDGTGSNAAGQILFPLTLTGGVTAFTLTNAASGKLTGTGTGSAEANAVTLTGTAVDATSKTIGSYTATVTLTITY
jgi:spore coat protein U-like protein